MWLAADSAAVCIRVVGFTDVVGGWHSCRVCIGTVGSAAAAIGTPRERVLETHGNCVRW